VYTIIISIHVFYNTTVRWHTRHTMIVYVTCTKVERRKYDVSATYDIYFSISFNTAICSVFITVITLTIRTKWKKPVDSKNKKTFRYDCCAVYFFAVVKFSCHRLFVYLMTLAVHFILRKTLSYRIVFAATHTTYHPVIGTATARVSSQEFYLCNFAQ